MKTNKTNNNRLRNVVFTWNNYKDEDISYLKKLVEEKFFVAVIFGKEIGKETKTKHLQCYGELSKQVAFSTVKAKLPNCHIEKRMGTQVEAIEYCKKEGDYEIFGTFKKQGARSDLYQIIEAIEEGKSPASIIKAGDTYSTAAIVSINALQTLFSPQINPNEEISVFWYYGKVPKIKTQQAYLQSKRLIEKNGFKKEIYWHRDCSSKWYDGYNSNDVVIFDEVYPDFFTPNNLNTLLEPYPNRVEKKGSSINFCAKVIIVTSYFSPIHYCKYNNQEIYQTKRLLTSIDKIFHIHEKNNIIQQTEMETMIDKYEKFHLIEVENTTQVLIPNFNPIKTIELDLDDEPLITSETSSITQQPTQVKKRKRGRPKKSDVA